MGIDKDNLELIKEFGINGYESVRSLAELNLRSWENLVAKQVDTMSLLIDSGIEQVKVNHQRKGPSSLITSQAELNRDLGENLIAKSHETVDLANATRDEYRAWFENGINTFNQKVANLTKKVF